MITVLCANSSPPRYGGLGEVALPCLQHDRHLIPLP
jgi:hypothetical protein